MRLAAAFLLLCGQLCLACPSSERDLSAARADPGVPAAGEDASAPGDVEGGGVGAVDHGPQDAGAPPAKKDVVKAVDDGSSPANDPGHIADIPVAPGQCPTVPTRLAFELIGLDEDGDGVQKYLGRVKIEDSRPWEGGADFEWFVKMKLPGGSALRLRLSTPIDAAIALIDDHTVNLAVKTTAGANPARALLFSDVEGTGLLFLYDGPPATDLLFPVDPQNGVPFWYDCSALQACRYLRQMDEADCPPVAERCGTETHPTVETWPFWGRAINRVREGEESTDVGGARFAVALSRRLEPGDEQCKEYPKAWVQAVAQGKSLTDDCDPTVLDITYDNPDRFELFEICVRQNGVDPIPGLKEIAPELSCPSGGHFGRCSSDETACTGSLERAAGSSGRLPYDVWKTLCRLSKEPAVRRIRGGHYL
jgi:hypothetical protein